MKYTAAELVKKYIELRSLVKMKTEEFDKKLKKVKDTMSEIEDELMRIANEAGVESLKTEFGTASKATTSFVTVEDWDKAVEFIRENEMWQMLNKSVKKSEVTSYMDDHNGATPPGLKFGQKVSIQIRAPRTTK